MPSRPPRNVFEYGGLIPTRSTTLPGRMSLNRPNPVRSTVFGAACQASAVRGCRIASGVDAKIFPRCVSIRRVERLIDVVRNRVPRSRQPRHRIVRIHRIRIMRRAETESPGQRSCHFPGVLRVKIQVEKVVRLRIRLRKCLRRGRRNSVNKLRQSRVAHRRHHSLAEIIIVQPENPNVGPEPKLMRAAASTPGCR